MTFHKIIFGTSMSSIAIATLMGCQSISNDGNVEVEGNQVKVRDIKAQTINKPILQEELKFDSPFHQPTIKSSSTMHEELQQYHWQLNNAVDSQNKKITTLTKNPSTIVLNFTKNMSSNKVYNNVEFGVGCNNMGANYHLKDSKLVLGSIISTKMYCEDKNLAESKLAELMSDHSKLSVNKNTLLQTTTDGSVLTWYGTLTDEAKYGKGETIFLEVAPKTKFCSIGIDQKCLKVREVYYNDNWTKSGVGDWKLMKRPIKGYQHNPENRTTLRVKKYISNSVDIKGKQIAYVLDMTVETERVKDK